MSLTVALYQSKNFSITRFSISQNFTYANQLSGSLSSFLLLSQNFLKICKTFCNIYSHVRLFSTPVSPTAATVPRKRIKEPQIKVFCSFFNQMFWFVFFIAGIFESFFLNIILLKNWCLCKENLPTKLLRKNAKL